ncbi:hypothetical protein WR25_19577 [Diploscapter pachys]|uniref:CRAL-TRIO domain-containing protein n=1 Tax=Diploscapter pachys TaxID=2018661 RepID=A0A2A2LC77_9BILA|nr:hypothetical protein WR25_19577 [Diploscapter pachys]
MDSEELLVKQFVGVSKLQADWVNDFDNGFVVVEASVSNPDDFLKTVSAYDFMKYLIAASEMLQYLIIEREEETGQQSHGLCIYDIKDIHPDYRDKSKDIHKMIKLRVHLWKDYYANLLKGIFIVNGGMLIEATSMIPLVGRNLLNTILKHHIKDRLCDQIEVGDRELKKAISLNAIPIGMRGERPQKPGETPNGCMKTRAIEEDDHYKPGQIYRKFAIDAPEPAKLELKDGESRMIELSPEGKQILLFSCELSAIVRFYFVQDDVCLTPPIKLRSIKTPNEGSVILPDANSPVILHIANHGEDEPGDAAQISYSVAFV